MLNNYLSNKDIEKLFLIMSEAVDIGTDNLAQHQIRTAYIAWEISKKLELNKRDTSEIVISSLFHDVGAISESFKLPMGLMEFSDSSAHCIKGERILQDFPKIIKGSTFVRYHHTDYETLKNVVDKKFHLGSQILFLSDYVDRISRKFNNNCVLSMSSNITPFIIDLLASGKVMKQVSDAFEEVSIREDFWLNLNSPSIMSLLFDEENLFGLKNKIQLSSILNFIVTVVDMKSYYTVAHSTGVAVASKNIGDLLGMSNDDVEWLYLAGYLHDIGKIAVPQEILDKPGKLTKEEYMIIKRHPYYSYRILYSVDGLRSFANAAFHHENNKGSGYPFKLKGSDLSEREKIIGAGDLFTALYEDRPYRSRMKEKEILKIIDERMSAGLMDKKIGKIIKNYYGEVSKLIIDKQKEMQEIYNGKFVNF